MASGGPPVRDVPASGGEGYPWLRLRMNLHPGESFAAGELLAELHGAGLPPRETDGRFDKAALAEHTSLAGLLRWLLLGTAEVLAQLLSAITSGRVRMRALPRRIPLRAPEAGILTWASQEQSIRPGSVVARFIPLDAWRDYGTLLADQDQRIRAGTLGHFPPSGALAAEEARLQAERDALRDQAAMRAQAARALLPQSAAETVQALNELLESGPVAPADFPAAEATFTVLRRECRRLCPLALAEIYPLYSGYFAPAVSLRAHFAAIDAEFFRRLGKEGDTPNLRQAWDEAYEAAGTAIFPAAGDEL